MNGKWLLSIGLPIVLMAGFALAAPLMYYDIRLDTTQPDANVVRVDDYTATVKHNSQIRLVVNVWIADPVAYDATMEPNVGFQSGKFGVKSSTGGLLGNLQNLNILAGYLDGGGFLHGYRTTPGYLLGINVDTDADGDKDLGGIYQRSYKDLAYDANYADFPSPYNSSTAYSYWYDNNGDDTYTKGSLSLDPITVDGVQYYGFRIAMARFNVTSPLASIPDLNTALTIFPYFYATPALKPHKFIVEGTAYNLTQPVDPNYAPQTPGYYVEDLSSFDVQSLRPINIIGIPEPTVMCLTLVGAVALLSRRRRKA